MAFSKGFLNLLVVATLLGMTWWPGVRAVCGDDGSSSGVVPFSSVPAAFIENVGQIDDAGLPYSVRYVLVGSGAGVLHTTAGPVIRVARPGVGAAKAFSFTVSFPGARQIEPVGTDRLPAWVNYYTGDARTWRTAVPAFAAVVYRGLYDGIDLHTFARRSNLKYEFHVAAGADWSRITVRYDGADRLFVDGAGALHVVTPLGELVDDAPVAWQVIGGRTLPVPARYRLIDGASCAFDLSNVDPRYELVIDPDLTWASFLGGSGKDYAWSVKTDSAGNVCIAGYTDSANFPASGAHDSIYNGGVFDAFVAKLNATGQLAWATFLGGGNWDKAYCLTVDQNGNALVAGETKSGDFPTTAGLDTTLGGLTDAFLVKLNANGMLVWSRFLGGSSYDWAYAVATDSSSNVFITGQTDSPDLSTTGAYDRTLSSYDAFVAKTNPSGQLQWATYLGGSTSDIAYGIAVDATGAIVVTGQTTSVDFPAFGGIDASFGGGDSDAFVAKLSGNGQSLAWARFLGGSGTEVGYGIAVDLHNNILVIGQTDSPDFPTSAGFDSTCAGGDAFVAQLGSSGHTRWSTFLGGSGYDEGHGIATDSSGNALVAGYTRSADFPAGAGFDSQLGGAADGFAAKISDACELRWATFLGGESSDGATAISVDSSGNAVVVGWTASADFPVPNGHHAIYNGGDQDAFVARISTKPQLTIESVPPGVSLTGDRPGTTPYAASCEYGQEVRLAAPLVAVVAGVRYDFSRWLLNGTARPDGETTVAVTVNDDSILCAVYEVRTHTLVVESVPFPGIAISGDQPGTTSYAHVCRDQQVVNLVALPAAAQAGLDYRFARWVVDGADQPDGMAAVQLVMDAGHTAIAVYEIETRILTVQSTPIIGIAISGSRPGTSNYSVACQDEDTVTLAAPPDLTEAGRRYVFHQWIVDGTTQAVGQAGLELAMDAHHTAVAAYGTTRYVSLDGAGDFTAIQDAIAAAADGDIIVVRDATYSGPGNFNIDLLGKAVVLRSENGPDSCTIDCHGGMFQPRSGLLLRTGEGPQTLVEGFTIIGGWSGDGGAIYCIGSSPTLRNLVIAGNEAYFGGGVFCFNASPAIVNVTIAGNTAISGGGIYCEGSAWPTVISSIVWGNSGQQTVGSGLTASCCDVQGGRAGIGNIAADPLFANPAQQDYHLKSRYGRWHAPSASWMKDDVTSPCIDAGDPQADNTTEPQPNGGRINMGAYGNTPAASKSAWPLAVRSVPVTGLAITGDHPGVTDYTVNCLDGLVVHLATASDAAIDTVRYRFLRWTLDGVPQPDGQTALTIVMNAEHAATAVYEIWTQQLAVQSLPIGNVAVSGSRPGITDYAVACNDQETVTLAAPAMAAAGPVRYDFVRWVIDGIDQQDGKSTVQIAMNADRSAVALYRIRTHVLHVKSEPGTAIEITGDKPGSTDYDAACADQETVTITAPWFHDNGPPFFIRWKDAEGATLTCRGTLSLVVTDDLTAIAEYADVAEFYVNDAAPDDPVGAGSNDNPGTSAQAPMASIQALLERYRAALPPASCTVHVAPGTYTEVSTIDAAEVSLLGAGADRTIIRGGDGPCLSILGGTVSGFTFTNGNGNSRGGGGIHAVGDALTIIDCTIIANSGARGGGILLEAQQSSSPGQQPVIIGCTIAGNTAEFGGGICSLAASATIAGCRIAGNSAGTGGGVCLATGSAQLANCIIAGNSAESGGAVDCTDTPRLTNLTITGNTATLAGGGIRTSFNSQVSVSGCILWGDTAPAGPEIALVAPSALAISYSDVAGGQAAAHVDAGATLGWGSGNIAADPLFANPAAGDYHLRSKYGRWDPAANAGAGGWVTDPVGSPCIDGGDPASDYSNEPQPNFGRANIGAFGNTAQASRSGWHIPGDVNADCAANILDLLQVRNHLRQNPATTGNWKYDVNRDLKIDILDLIYVRNYLSTRCR